MKVDFNIKDFKVEPLRDGKFIKPYLAKFKLNGKERDWELIKTSDSVAILIYNRDSDSFVFVRQFRPAVYFNQGDGVTIELCAGILDKELTIPEIGAEEVFEETGFKVDFNELEEITTFYTSVGFAGSKQHLYFVEVNESKRVNSGGGVAGEELIEVVEVSRESIKDFILNGEIKKTPGLIFAIYWFLDNKVK